MEDKDHRVLLCFSSGIQSQIQPLDRSQHSWESVSPAVTPRSLSSHKRLLREFNYTLIGNNVCTENYYVPCSWHSRHLAKGKVPSLLQLQWIFSWGFKITQGCTWETRQRTGEEKGPGSQSWPPRVRLLVKIQSHSLTVPALRPRYLSPTCLSFPIHKVGRTVTAQQAVLINDISW